MSKKTFSVRKLFNDLHLWLGLGSGIIIFITCLTGTLLTFNESIRAQLATPIEINTALPVKNLEELSKDIKALDKGKINSITIPSAADKPYKLNLKTSKEDRRGTNFVLDQYSSEVHSIDKTWYDEFYMFNFKMHRWLMNEDIGRPIVGTSTIILIFLTLSGLILWIPKKIKASWKVWKPGFKIKTNARWKRLNHDLHNVLGFYTFLVVLVMSLTGLCWSFEWYKDGASAVLGAKVFDRGADKKFKSDTIQNLAKMSPDGILDLTNKTLDYKGTTRISFPSKPSDTYIVTKYSDDAASSYLNDKLIFDQNGSLLKKDLYADKPLNTKIASLIRPIHTGEFYGLWSEIIYFISCLIATSLPITGTFIWWNKRKKKKKKENGLVRQ